MNRKAFDHIKKKYVHTSDSSNDPHIVELFTVSQTFEKWKEEVGGFTEHFITKWTYENF
jgi:hypothetical protein